MISDSYPIPLINGLVSVPNAVATLVANSQNDYFFDLVQNIEQLASVSTLVTLTSNSSSRLYKNPLQPKGFRCKLKKYFVNYVCC